MFSITCTTCQARLLVRSASAVGAILECPKCGSMVQVVPPEGWDAAQAKPPEPGIPAALEAPTVVMQSEGILPAMVAPSTRLPPPLPPRTAAAEVASSSTGSAGTLPAAAQSGRPHSQGVRHWLLLAGAPVAAVVVVAGAVSLVLMRRAAVVPSAAEITEPTQSASTVLPVSASSLPSQPVALPRRWLPEPTRLLTSFRPSQWATEANLSRTIDRAGLPWQTIGGAISRSLGLNLEKIGRLTWAATDLTAWPERGVAIIELSDEHDATRLTELGEAADVRVAGAVCRRLPGAAWPHPWAVVEPKTIITGPEVVLRQLGEGHPQRLESAALERLLKAMGSGADVIFLVDLAAARKANWKLPSGLWDFWPTGKQPWHLLCDLPDALGCTWQCGDHLSGELALVCEGETTAEKVYAALREFLPAAKVALAGQVETIPVKLKGGQLTAAAASSYETLLKQGLAAVQAARSEIAETIVWTRWDCGESPAGVLAAALDSQPAVRADWLAAARGADEAMHRRLSAGLGGYQKAEGHFPAGAAGSALLPAETRLSWIATLLPYYGHAEWHRKLEFGYPWNAAQNRAVTRQPLPEVVNPALGSESSDAGFPVSNYVGVAGVGEDAARLDADSPRAGMFGHGRGTRLPEITKGAANTIALLGVAGRLGPWAAGGNPTVRALTQPPYVNGPDGFGSGQPDGMLASMADGSVRFLSQDIDPHVLEQLAVIHGPEKRAAAAPRADNSQPQVATNSAAPKAPLAGTAAPLDGPKQSPHGNVSPGGKTPASQKPERGSQPVKKRPAPTANDLAARLATPIAGLELSDVPLLRAVRSLASLGNVPVTIDADAVWELEVALSDPVTVRLSQTTLAKALEAVVSSRGLSYAVENGQILVTSPPAHREVLRPRRYTVADLGGSGPAALDELAALLQKLVVPESWRANGGRGTVTTEAGVLQVVQTDAVHHRVLMFCEQLRNARGKPLRSRYDPERFALVTRLDRAKGLLGRTLSVNFHEPAPLEEILAYLEELTEADILVDQIALTAAGQTSGVQATLTAENQTLAAALTALLQPLGLAYRAIDADTLQVTSRKALDARLDLEFYPLAGVLAKGQTAAALVEKIKARLGGATWNDAGGPGVLYWDQPSNCLLVLQSQPVHAALQQLLAEKVE